MTNLKVNIEKVIHASMEKVFDARLDPNIMSKFVMGMPDMPDAEVTKDAREGGSLWPPASCPLCGGSVE